MGKLSQQAESIMSQIDAIKTLLERYRISLDIFDNLNVSMSPIAFLLGLLKHLGLSYDQIVEWLANYIVYVTPILEITLKGILLAKLKSNIDCNLDPRIPKYLREEIGGCTTIPLLNMGGNGDSSQQTTGIEIDLSTIDSCGLLNNSPMSDRSQYMYFGTKKYYDVEGLNEKIYNYEEIVNKCITIGIDPQCIKKHSEIDSVYELVRANDMNAFLWFILHKAKFLNISDINNYVGLDNGKNILSVITGETDASTTDNIVSLGACYTQRDGSNEFGVMGLCIKNTPQTSAESNIKDASTSNSNSEETSNSLVALSILNQNQNVTKYEYTIVPTTNIWNGCNWYVNRSQYFNFWNAQPRDYDNEFALFRLCMKEQDGINTNKLLFTIKPAPNVVVPNFNVDIYGKKTEEDKKLNFQYNGSTPWSFHMLLFDKDGKQKTWGGKYSVVLDNSQPTRQGQYNIYKLKSPITNDIISGIKLHVNMISREYKLVTEGCENIRTALYECYPGFTVYEFNYDFIMGMKLFDATVITAQLIEGLTNIRLGLGASVKKEVSDYQMRISEIVKKMLETNGYESSDCFYSFSNETFERMQEKSELKRAQLYPFQDEMYRATQVADADVYSVLNEFDSAATLEENISVISRSLTQASATITQEVLPEDKYSVELDFIIKGIEMITSIFVEALLSPKLLLIFAINKQIMGEEMPKDINIEKFLEAFFDIIVAMISEIIDMLIKKLLDFVLEKVKELLVAAMELLVLEQVEYYMRLLRQMLENCAFALPKSPNLASTLDNVDYADIDANDKPVTNEC